MNKEKNNIYICIRAYYRRLALSKVVIAFNDKLQDTTLKMLILIWDSCRFGYFDRPKTYQIFQKKKMHLSI